MDKTKGKRKYIKPDFEAEKVFEVNAPTCGKCASGSTGGFACARLLRNS